jgi:tRNA pseudouridine32 synthase/23S rRNA pseudouridine746 synthase
MACSTQTASRSDRERFDPPLLRHRWVTAESLGRAAFLAEARARSAAAGFGPAAFDRLLWHGGLHLDGRPHCGDELPGRVEGGMRVDLYAFAREPEAIPLGSERILAEGSDWLAADKPAWLPTQATRASRRLSLEAALRSVTGCAALAAVHRLDRETSGVVLLAKTSEAAGRLGRALAAGRARKRYLAVVSPAPDRECFQVSGFLGRVLDPRRYRFALRDAAQPGFRWSRTRFRCVAIDGVRAGVAAEPVTGRSHQIRVHLSASGTPIAGDVVYGGAAAARLLLHAVGLEIQEEAIAIEAPLPADLGPAFAVREGPSEARSPLRDARAAGAPPSLDSCGR